eukprot:sb/3473850/
MLTLSGVVALDPYSKRDFTARRKTNGKVVIQSDPDLPGPDLPEPRFTGRIKFPRYRKLTVFHHDIPGTPIYMAKSFPPRITVNRGPTLMVTICPGSVSSQLPCTDPSTVNPGHTDGIVKFDLLHNITAQPCNTLGFTGTPIYRED